MPGSGSKSTLWSTVERRPSSASRDGTQCDDQAERGESERPDVHLGVKTQIEKPGEQRVEACTEDGHETEVLFQIADVSRPLVSVSGVCERRSRVIFGRAGGVVQCLSTGREAPFYKRNGIYVLSMWFLDEKDASPQPFRRP